MHISHEGGWLAALVLVMINVGLLLAVLLVRARRSTLQSRAASLEAEVTRRTQREALMVRHSHDLRSLVTSITGLSEILTDPQPPADFRRKLQAFHAAAGDLHGSTVNLLSLLSGQDEMRGESTMPVDLREVLGLVKHDAQPAALIRGVAVDVVHTPYSPLLVLSQGQLLARILTNITRHTVALAQPGRLEITVLEAKEDGGLNFAITCTSVRMGRRASDKLFAPFGLEDGGTTRYPAGIGLNLATARRLAQNMGGTLTSSSDGISGIRFELRIPAEILSIDDGAVAASDRVVSINDPYIRHRRRVSRMRVLVCDGQPSSREMIVAAMEKAGHSVRHAPTAAEALEAMDGDPFDLLLVDFYLPDMSGPDLLRRVGLRAPEASGRFRSLVLSPELARAGRDESYRAGADGFLTKPLSVRRLLEAVEDLFEQRPISPKPEADGRRGEEPRPSAAVIAAIDDLVAYRNQLRLAVGENDWHGIRSQVRAIRGAAVTVNAPAVIELCRRVLEADPQSLPPEAASRCREISYEIDVAARGRGAMRKGQGKVG